MVKAALNNTIRNIDAVIYVHLDKDGYLLEPEKWNETIASYLAKSENIGAMSYDHWKLVSYIRDFYMRFGVAPSYEVVCRNTQFDLKRIHELFPGGLANGACKVAGLPSKAWCWGRRNNKVDGCLKKDANA